MATLVGMSGAIRSALFSLQFYNQISKRLDSDYLQRVIEFIPQFNIKALTRTVSDNPVIQQEIFTLECFAA